MHLNSHFFSYLDIFVVYLVLFFNFLFYEYKLFTNLHLKIFQHT